jgi:hypothetical protein
LAAIDEMGDVDDGFPLASSAERRATRLQSYDSKAVASFILTLVEQNYAL